MGFSLHHSSEKRPWIGMGTRNCHHPIIILRILSLKHWNTAVQLPSVVIEWLYLCCSSHQSPATHEFWVLEMWLVQERTWENRLKINVILSDLSVNSALWTRQHYKNKMQHPLSLSFCSASHHVNDSFIVTNFEKTPFQRKVEFQVLQGWDFLELSI